MSHAFAESERKRAVRRAIRDKLAAKLLYDHKRQTGQAASESLQNALMDTLNTHLQEGEVKLRSINAAFRRLVAQDAADAGHPPLPAAPPPGRSAPRAAAAATAAQPAAERRFRPHTARPVQASPDVLVPLPPRNDPAAPLRPQPQVQLEGGENPDVSCLWPERVRNPRKEGLRREADDEWTQRMKDDLHKYHDGLRRQRIDEVMSARRHRGELDTQVLLRNRRAEMERLADKEYAEVQQRMQRTMEDREAQLREEVLVSKREARRQMLDDLKKIDDAKRRRDQDRRAQNEVLRRQMQKDVEDLREDELMRLRKRQRAYEDARRIDNLAKEEKQRVVAKTREEDARITKEAKVRATRAAKARAREKRIRDQKQERLLSFGASVFTDEMKATLESKGREAEEKAQREMLTIEERYDRDVESRRRKREALRESRQHDLMTQQQLKEERTEHERAEGFKQRKALAQDVRDHARNTEDLQRQMRERVVRYVTGLKEQVETSPRWKGITVNITRQEV